MDIKSLRERIESLQNGLRDTDKQMELLHATRIATDGALQECQYWLKCLLEKHVAENPLT